MRGPFDPADHPKLIADPSLLDLDALEERHGSWGSQLLRNVLALEVLFQLTARVAQPPTLKGGTLLQSRLRWPPLRASIDLDLETRDAAATQAAVDAFVKRFAASRISLEATPADPLPGRVLKLSFPGIGLPEPRTLRIDLLETARAGEGYQPWADMPPPWKQAKPPAVPTLEQQAAQKLPLCSPAPFGRDLSSHRGRQNRIKDLFDLACLGALSLHPSRVTSAALQEVTRKSAYMGPEYQLPALLQASSEALLHLAGPPGHGPEERQAFWRAHAKVRPTIQEAFSPAQLRMAAGCSYCALAHIASNTLDWVDAWAPYRDRTPRSRWATGAPMQTVIRVEDGYGPEKGVLESWALP